MSEIDQKTPAKRKPGRPKGDGFHGALTPKLVEEYAKKLFSYDDIGALYGESRQNTYHAIKSNPELKEAFDKGQAQALDKVTGALMSQIEKGNIVAILFALKSKFKWVEYQYLLNKQDQAEMPKVTIYLPDNGRDPAVTENAKVLEND